MQLGYLGLGKMGKNMVLRLLEKKHEVVAWNRSPEPRKEVAAAGATAVETIEEVVSNLQTPKTVWVMLPAGEVTNQTIEKLSMLLSQGDTVIDGANSFYKDSVANSQLLESKGINFLDAGVSGGPAGARNGACVMVGGKKEMFDKYQQLFTDIAAPEAVGYFGRAGAGHFVKMVHNGIEYGMMQAIGEGFAVMKQSDFNLDLTEVARVYGKQSVITSRLIDWLKSGYDKHSNELEGISGSVKHSGEGQWTVETAKEMGISVPVIEAAFQFRLDSDANPSYTGKVVSTLRNEFGGHEVAEK